MPEHTPSPTPERAIYGFVLYLSAYVCLAVYMMWAYLPDEMLHAIGLTYWPQRYWVLAAPTYFMMSIIFLVIFYVSYNFIITKPLNSIYTVTDKNARSIDTSDLPREAIPPIGDLSISEVNLRLYMK